MKTTVKGARAFLMVFITGFMLLMFSSTSFTTNAHAQTPGSRLITLCHFGRIIQVDQKAVSYHLLHGDKIGICGPATPINR